MNGLIKKMLVFLLVMAAVGATGWYGRKAYKRATERRAVSEAAQYLKKNDARNTILCLQRALQVNSRSIPASVMMSDLLDAAGQPAALSWRIRVVQLDPDNMTNRLLEAETAIKLHDLKSAGDALGSVNEKARATALYQKLAGALAWSRGQNGDAEKYFREALRLEPTNMSIVLNLATIGMSSTNQDAANAARASMERVAAQPQFRLAALHHLVKDAAERKSYGPAINFAAEIAHDPDATIQDRMDYLQLLNLGKNANFTGYLAAQKAEAEHSPVLAFALGRWMIAADGPASALRWMQTLPATVQTNQPVPLVMADCQIDVKDWKGLLAMVEKQDWLEANCFRLALVSLAERSLQDEPAAQSAWRKSVHLSAHRLERLTRLCEVTAAWGWDAENTEVLNEIIAEFPKEKWAVDQLATKFYATGNTRDLASMLAKVYAADSEDPRLKNNLANVFLLRKFDLETAHRLAREAYNSSPQNPFYTSTYAYSLLLQNKNDEALKIISALNPEYLKIPSVAAYYGVVEAQSGHKDIAKEPLERASAAKLLPEENEMVRTAIARL